MRQRLEVGDTLGEVFSRYREQAGVLLPLAFWLFLAVAILDGLLDEGAAFVLLVLVVSTIAGTLYQGVVVGLVRDLQDGRRDPSIAQLLRAAAPFILPLASAGVLAALGIGIGIVLLLVPGLYLLTIWAVIAPAIVIEGKGVFAAFRRSKELVSGHGWNVFGVVVIAFLIAVLGALLLNAIAEEIAGGPLLRIVFSALASTVTAPVEALVAAVLYYRLRAFEPAGEPEPPTT